MLPPLPAIGSVRIEIWGPEPTSARWDQSNWDDAVWSKIDWQDITPQSMNVQLSWGADDPAGVLTVPAAGSWSIATYDPDRLLDPSNGGSPYSSSIRPGHPIRLSYINALAERKSVRVGLIDEVSYDLTARTGALRGTDLVQLLVGAKLLEGQQLDLAIPATLRARAQYLIAKAGLSKLVPTEAAPVDDPPVGPVLALEASVWEHILTAAYDALYAVWMNRVGTLSFRSFGDPADPGVQVGGVDGIPIDNMTTQGSLQGVFTKVIGYDATAPTVKVEAVDIEKAEIYGDIILHREQPVPNARAWVDSVLLDRAGAALQYSPGTLRPQTEDQLESILDLGMISLVHLLVDSVHPPINISARVLGGVLEANTTSGWSARLITYIPATEWEEAEAPIIPPIEPPLPPDVITGVWREYACTEDTRIVSSSSLKAGNGVDDQIAVGYVSGYKNRMLVDFDNIPFAGVVAVEKAELHLTTSSQTCCSFGSDPKIVVERITEGWAEGSYSAACGFGTSNSTVWPGPSKTSTGAKTNTVPNGENADFIVDITTIARAWLGGSTQQGLSIKSAGEDITKYTTEFWSRHQGTAGKRPKLRLRLTIEA